MHHRAGPEGTALWRVHLASTKRVVRESVCLRRGLCVSTCCDWRGSSLQLCPVSARAMHSATANSGFKTWLTPVDSGCLWWFQVRFQSEPCPRRGIARTTSQNTVKIDCVPQLDHREKDGDQDSHSRRASTAGRLGGTRLHARSHTVPHKALESIHFQPSQASHQDEFVVDTVVDPAPPPCSKSHVMAGKSTGTDPVRHKHPPLLHEQHCPNRN